MRAAAKLTRKFSAADAQDADLGAVFLAKHRDRTRTHRVLEGHHVGRDRLILEDIAVDEVLDLSDLGRRHRLVMRKVEPQIIRRNDRAGLLYMRAENFL